MLVEALAIITPPAILYKWYTSGTPTSPDGEQDAGYGHGKVEPIVSDAFGMSILSQIRAFIWGDSIMQKGYDQVRLFIS